MGLIVKKDGDERDYIDGIEIIERTDTPDDLPEVEVDLVDGRSAEDIAAAGDGDEPKDAEAADGADGDWYEALSDGGDVDGDGEGAGDGGSSDDGDGDVPAAQGHPSVPRRPLIIAGIAAAIVIAGILGYFIGSGGFAPSAVSSAVLAEDELGDTVASYTFGGARHDVSAQEAIESEFSLEAIQNEDGTYPTPSAETVISYVRNTILLDEAEARGIEVTDDDLEALAQSMLQTTDFTAIADQYGVTEDQARQILRESAMIQKLQEQIVPGYTTLTGPSEPTSPENGDTQASSPEYAQYILDLAGDAWDAEAGTWSESDNSYSVALGDIDLASGSATYEQAITAYYVAYQNFLTEATDLSNAWAEFTNGLYAEADVTLYGVYA